MLQEHVHSAKFNRSRILVARTDRKSSIELADELEDAGLQVETGRIPGG